GAPGQTASKRASARTSSAAASEAGKELALGSWASGMRKGAGAALRGIDAFLCRKGFSTEVSPDSWPAVVGPALGFASLRHVSARRVAQNDAEESLVVRQRQPAGHLTLRVGQPDFYSIF